MRMNWGHKLTLVFLVFGSMTGYLVYRCSQTKFDLVSKEYYKDELAYQQVIDASRHARLLNGNVSVLPLGDSLLINLPVAANTAGINGHALFYCTADAAKDRKIILKPGPSGEQFIGRSQLMPGSYLVKFSWSAGANNYYAESSVVIK